MHASVSVVMPVYNAAPFVAAAVRSALALPEVGEVLLVEDGSTDDSLAQCRALAAGDARVRLLQHPGGANRGASASRNLGMRAATRPFVAFLDADDLFLPGRFAAEPGIFAQHPDADGVYGAIGAHYLDAEGRDNFERVFKDELTTVRHRVPPERLFDAFMGLVPGVENLGHFSLDGLTLRRTALDRMPELMNTALHMHEDSEFIVRMAWHLRLHAGIIDRPVASRGVHAGNRITRVADRERSRWNELRVLADWADRTGLSAAQRARVHARERAHRVLGAQPAERWGITLLVLRHPGVLRREDVGHAWIRLWLGADGGASRLVRRAWHALHAGLLRLRPGKAAAA